MGRPQPRSYAVLAGEAKGFASGSTPSIGSPDPKPSVHAKSQEGFSNSDQTAAGSVAGPKPKRELPSVIVEQPLKSKRQAHVPRNPELAGHKSHLGI
jgi:hypothetical protein